MLNRDFEVTKEEFKRFQDFIQTKIGIKFPKHKLSLLESRLYMHIKSLGLNSFGSYLDIVTKDHDEYEFFVDKITTHTTFFFRENHHFNFLEKKGISMINDIFKTPVIKILSLASSSGEEMYTLALIFHTAWKNGQVRDYEIHGADISKKSLLKAKEGVFKDDHLASIPNKYKGHFKSYADGMIKATPDLKRNMRFFLLNAGKPAQTFPTVYHIIFCRNMLIYFNKELQQIVIDNVQSNLLKNGIFCVGHSESLLGLEHSLRKIEPTIYANEK